MGRQLTRFLGCPFQVAGHRRSDGQRPFFIFRFHVTLLYPWHVKLNWLLFHLSNTFYSTNGGQLTCPFQLAGQRRSDGRCPFFIFRFLRYQRSDLLWWPPWWGPSVIRFSPWVVTNQMQPHTPSHQRVIYESERLCGTEMVWTARKALWLALKGSAKWALQCKNGSMYSDGLGSV